MQILAFAAPEMALDRPQLVEEMRAGLSEMAQKNDTHLYIVSETDLLVDAGWDDLLNYLSYRTGRIGSILLMLPGKYIGSWDAEAPIGLARLVKSTVVAAGDTPILATINDYSDDAAEKLLALGVKAVSPNSADDAFTHIYKEIELQGLHLRKEKMSEIEDAQEPMSLRTAYIEAQGEEDATVPKKKPRAYTLRPGYNYAASTIELYTRVQASAARVFNSANAVTRGVFSYDLENRLMQVDGQELRLSNFETTLLKHLLAGETFKAGRMDVLRDVYADRDEMPENATATFGVQLHKFRTKLEKFLPEHIKGRDVIILDSTSPHGDTILRHALIEEADLRKPQQGGAPPNMAP